MHTVFALLCFVVAIHWLIFPYPSGLLHWHCGNLTIAPVPAKQATLMNMDKYLMWNHYELLHNHNKTKHNKTVCIFLGIYCYLTTPVHDISHRIQMSLTTLSGARPTNRPLMASAILITFFVPLGICNNLRSRIPCKNISGVKFVSVIELTEILHGSFRGFKIPHQ